MFGAKKGPEVSKIEPPYWWVGMANDTLQLMVYGTDIAKATASVDYPGVHIAESVSLDSPNYKLLYLTIDSDTKPGKMPLTLICRAVRQKLIMNCAVVISRGRNMTDSLRPMCFIF